VCHLKTNALEILLPEAFVGETLAYSPYVTREHSFNLRPSSHSSAPALRAKLIDPRIEGEWDHAVAEYPHATIFHTSAWANVLCDTYGHAPHYFSLSQGEKRVALVPMMEVKSAFTGCRGVCLPFSDFCGPLISGESSLATSILDRLSGLARERAWKYFEVRAALPSGVAVPARDSFHGHRLSLTKSPDDLFKGFASSVRRAIRKAERSALSVEVTSESGAIPRFYRLHNQTRRRHGIPPQPLSFFQNIHAHVIKRGLGFLVIAHLDARPIAAGVFFHFGRQALFKFGASDDRYQEYRANNLVMWEGIKHAAQLGAETLHLGRTDLGHAGLRRFKLSLGAEEEMLHYFRFDATNARWMNKSPQKPSSLPGAVFRSLPLTVNRLAGTVLYPHLH